MCVCVYRAAHYIVFAGGCGALNVARWLLLQQTPKRCSACSPDAPVALTTFISDQVCKFARASKNAARRLFPFALAAQRFCLLLAPIEKRKTNRAKSLLWPGSSNVHTERGSAAAEITRQQRAERFLSLRREFGSKHYPGILAKKAVALVFWFGSTHTFSLNWGGIGSKKTCGALGWIIVRESFTRYITKCDQFLLLLRVSFLRIY